MTAHAVLHRNLDVNRQVPEERGAEWAVRAFWQPSRYDPALAAALEAKTAPMTEAVLARVDHGRWVVDCPSCSSAQYGCKTDHRFMCVECHNVTANGLWRPVIWPKNHEQIEKALAHRATANHHWRPGETIAQLEAENAAGGPALVLAEWQHPRWFGVGDNGEKIAPHTHDWPKKADDDGMVTCRDCTLTIPHAEVLANKIS